MRSRRKNTSVVARRRAHSRTARAHSRTARRSHFFRSSASTLDFDNFVNELKENQVDSRFIDRCKNMNPNERNRTLEYSKNILRGLRLLKTLETKYDLSKLDQRLYGLASDNASMTRSAVGTGLLTAVLYWAHPFKDRALLFGALLTIAEEAEVSGANVGSVLPRLAR